MGPCPDSKKDYLFLYDSNVLLKKKPKQLKNCYISLKKRTPIIRIHHFSYDAPNNSKVELSINVGNWHHQWSHWALLHSKNTDVKHEMKRQQWTKQQSGRSQLWGSWLPTQRSAGTPPAPAGTVGPGTWAARRRPRPPPGPGQTEPHGDASDPPDPSRPPCSPTSHRWSQDARKAESWTRWRSGRHSSGEGLITTGSNVTRTPEGRKKCDSHFVWSDRTWRCRCSPSSVGSPGTLPWSRRTGSPSSWASRTGPRRRSPLEQSCSDWSGCWARDSRCCTQSVALESFCLRRTQSASTQTWQGRAALTDLTEKNSNNKQKPQKELHDCFEVFCWLLLPYLSHGVHVLASHQTRKNPF